MPKNDMLVNSIYQQISDTASQWKTYFIATELNYSQIRLNLHLYTAKQCNFNITSGHMTVFIDFKVIL